VSAGVSAPTAGLISLLRERATLGRPARDKRDDWPSWGAHDDRRWIGVFADDLLTLTDLAARATAAEAALERVRALKPRRTGANYCPETFIDVDEFAAALADPQGSGNTDGAER